MYVIGHSAISYLVIKLIYQITGKELKPKIIIFSIFFGNLIDIFHFGIYRTISHSLIGTVVIGITVILGFFIIRLIEKNDLFILSIVILSHIPADYGFSTFIFFYPFNFQSYSIFSFNSLEDVIIEIFLGVIFLIVMILTKDFDKVRSYISDITRNTRNYIQPKNKRYFDILILLLYVGFNLFVVGQFYIYLILNQQLLLKLYWYILLFLIIWILFIIIFVSIIPTSFRERDNGYQTR